MRLLDAAGTTELCAASVPNKLAEDGLVLIRHGSLEELRALLAGWTEAFAHPDDYEPGMTAIMPMDPAGGTSTGRGFTTEQLSPHTDRCLQVEAPSLLAAMMISPATAGGQALLADGATVLTTLRRRLQSTAIDHLRLRTRGGETVPIAMVRDGLATIRFRDDEVAVPRSTDGDPKVVRTLRDAITAATWSLPLHAGDGYLLHNHRYLHGRTGFAGHRRLERLLANVTCSRFSYLNHGFAVAEA